MTAAGVSTGAGCAGEGGAGTEFGAAGACAGEAPGGGVPGGVSAAMHATDTQTNADNASTTDPSELVGLTDLQLER